MANSNGKRNGTSSKYARNGRKYNGSTGNGRDWEGIKVLWHAAPPGMSGAEFCRIHKIPYSTAKYHLKFSDKPDDPLADAIIQEHAFLDRLKKECGGATREYVKSMRRASTTLEKISEMAAGDYVRLAVAGEKYHSPAEAGRLAIAASKQLVDLSVEIDSVPDERDLDGWPLTRAFRPFDYQRDFIFDTPASLAQRGETISIMAFIAGIGSGKTRCGAEKLGDVAWMNRGLMGGVFAPTYRMLEDATKQMIFDVLHAKNISYRYRKTDNAIILFGDTKIIFRSMDDPEHLRGPNLAWAWIDEGGQMKTREAFDVIMGRVRHPDAGCRLVWLTTTPKGLGWLYDICIEDPKKHRTKVYHGTTKMNTALPPEYFETLMDVYDPKLALQELQGEFINVFSGIMYWNFQRGKNTFKMAKSPFKYDPTMPLYLTCDFNVSPMCWNLFQRFGDVDIGIDEIHIDTASTQIAIHEFVDRYHDHKGEIYVYGDANWGRARKTSATHTDFEIIEKGLRHGNNPRKKKFTHVDIRVGRSNPAIKDRIAAVNARYLTASGKRLLYFIAEKNKYTIMDNEKCGFIPGTTQPDEKDKQIGHHMAAVGYLINWEYPIFGPRVTHGRKRTK